MVCKMLGWLCATQPSARATALRALVEAVIDSTPSALFGRVASKNTSANPPLLSLLQENLKQVSYNHIFIYIVYSYWLCIE